jgi:hypothetical protein
MLWERKYHSKFVHAMESHMTCHNFRICIKIGIACMFLVVAIIFVSV